MTSSRRTISRRRLLAGATAAGTFSFFPGFAFGQRQSTSPNEKLNIACIGVGNRGFHNLNNVASENIVALCDVDDRQAGPAYARYPDAKRFRDFRRMFDQMEREIDAVVVSTPDHTHAVASIEAMRRGKHLYCEKPLTHDVREVRAVLEVARESKVATQLGNQGHSAEDIRRFCEWIWDGAIGTVREVHAFCHSDYGRQHQLDEVKQAQPIPDTLDWDLWLGPAEHRPYNSLFVPGTWRAWMPFGCGVVGDWVCHVLDPVYWALDLGSPTTIAAETFDYDPTLHGLTVPNQSTIEFEFPAKEDRPAVKIIWYDGASRPDEPEELTANGESLPDIGALVIGDEGKIVYGSHGASGVRILPDEKMRSYQEPEKTIPRSQGHHADWIAACKGGPPASSNFEYGAPLAEVALLGVVAIRSAGRKLTWKPEAMQFTGDDEATQFLQWPYRNGWEL